MDVNTQQRLNEAIVAVQRFANSRKLDKIHTARSGVALSTVAVGVLRQVAKGEPLSASELGKAALMQPAALSRQINVLKDGGHIELGPDPDDGRVSIVRTTDAGRRALRLFDESNSKLLSAQLRSWDDDEILALADQIQRLVADLRTTLPDEA